MAGSVECAVDKLSFRNLAARSRHFLRAVRQAPRVPREQLAAIYEILFSDDKM